MGRDQECDGLWGCRQCGAYKCVASDGRLPFEGFRIWRNLSYSKRDEAGEPRRQKKLIVITNDLHEHNMTYQMFGVTCTLNSI